MKIRRLIPLRNAQMFNRRFLRYNFAKMKFWQQKIIGDFCKLSKDSAVSLRIEPTTFVLIDILGYHYVPVCCILVPQSWSVLIYREDWLSIKFGENDSFRELFLFFQNTFQYLGEISQEISESHFDSRRSLSSANRRQIVGDLPGRFFLSALLSLVISMTGRSERSARVLRDGADVVRETIGN